MDNKENILFKAEIRNNNSLITYKIADLQMIHEYSIETNIYGEDNQDNTEINRVKICRSIQKYSQLKEELKQVPSPIGLKIEANTNKYVKINLYDENIEFINGNLNDQVVIKLFKIINQYFNYYVFFDTNILSFEPEKVEKMQPISYTKDNLFYAYEGGYFGEIYNFHVIKQNDRLRFEKQLYKEQIINHKKYIIKERKIRLYPVEMLNLLEKNLTKATSSWQKKYVDNNILDGTSWRIELKEKFEYYGSNSYPKNYADTFKMINKYFN